MNTARPFEENQSLQCKLITGLDEWQQLAAVWDRLLHESPDRTPWQNFAFQTAWWKHLSDGRALRIFVVERGNTPCLILPLQLSILKPIPGLSLRTLEPISMIMDVNRPRFALGAPDPSAFQCALDAIWNRKQEWDLLRIDEKAWDDAEVAVLRDYALSHGCIFRQIFSHLVPYLDLRQTWDTYLKTRSQKMRKNLKTARRKLEAQGPVELRQFASADEVAQGFAFYLDLHSRSWKEKRKVEHSKSPGYRSFFAEWVAAMARQNACRVLVLFCGQEPVAATIAFIDAETYYSAQIVHDARYAACSPGTLLEAMELEILMNDGGYARYEFLGSFLNNKLRWSDTVTHSALALIYQRTLRAFIVDGYYSFLKPYVRPTIVRWYRKFIQKNKGATAI